MERRFWRSFRHPAHMGRNSRWGSFPYAHIMATIPIMTAIAPRPKMYCVILCIPAVSRSVLLAVFNAKASGTRRSIFKMKSGQRFSLLSGKKNSELRAHISDLSPSPVLLAYIRRLCPGLIMPSFCSSRRSDMKFSVFSASPCIASWSKMTLSAHKLHLSFLRTWCFSFQG